MDGQSRLVVSKLFPGLDAPEKLESYARRTVPPGGPSLADDVRGAWALQHDPFKGIAILRSLVYPGYFFYYSSPEVAWGGLYVGDGLQNCDLVFML